MHPQYFASANVLAGSNQLANQAAVEAPVSEVMGYVRELQSALVQVRVSLVNHKTRLAPVFLDQTKSCGESQAPQLPPMCQLSTALKSLLDDTYSIRNLVDSLNEGLAI